MLPQTNAVVFSSVSLNHFRPSRIFASWLFYWLGGSHNNFLIISRNLLLLLIASCSGLRFVGAGQGKIYAHMVAVAHTHRQGNFLTARICTKAKVYSHYSEEEETRELLGGMQDKRRNLCVYVMSPRAVFGSESSKAQQQLGSFIAWGWSIVSRCTEVLWGMQTVGS